MGLYVRNIDSLIWFQVYVPSIEFKDESSTSSPLIGFSNSLHLVGWQPTVAYKRSLKYEITI